MENETWLPIGGFEGLYSVSNLGSVRGEPRTCNAGRGRTRDVLAKPVKTFPCASSHGYPQVRLYRGGRGKTFLVHLLVIRAFRGDGAPGDECAHIDGSRDNPRLDNLEWKSHVANESDKARHGTRLKGDRCPWAKLSDESAKRIKADPRPQVVIAAEHGVSQTVVSRIKSGQRWAHV